MGGALVRGLVHAGYDDVVVYDVDERAFSRVTDLDVETTTDPEIASQPPIVFVAVKPQLVGIVIDELSLSSDQTVVSIAAGVPTDFVADHTDASVVRIMPNLAAEWGSMAAAATGELDADVWAILNELGSVVEVDEELMDTATAVNGSGPAFVFYLIKSMAAGGIEGGLSPADARVLAAQTFKGAAEMVLRSEEPIDELIDAVCSPNGTTIEGMAVLDESDVEAVTIEAIEAARERAGELAKEVAHERAA